MTDLPEQILPGDRITFKDGRVMTSPIPCVAAPFARDIAKIERPTTIFLTLYDTTPTETPN